MNNIACAVPHRECPYYQPTTGQCDYHVKNCFYQIIDDVDTYLSEKRSGLYD